MLCLGDGSMVPVVEGTGCSSRRSKFKSQHPPGIPKLTVVPVSEDMTPSASLHRHQAHMWHMQSKHPYTQNKIK